jgi:hypothetical protein
VILGYIKILFRAETDLKKKKEIKPIHDKIKQEVYTVSKHVEALMQEIVHNNGSFEELQDLLEDCEMEIYFENFTGYKNLLMLF